MLRVLKWRQFLKESERWSADKQIQYQNIKLKEIINHCYKNVPFYRRTFKEYDINPSSIREITDLEKLPTINRETLKSHYDELIADNFKKFRPQTVTTGGTTGVPSKYLIDYDTWSLHWAIKFRSWEHGNYKCGNPIAIMGGSSIIPDSKITTKRKLLNFVNRFHFMPGTSMHDELFYNYATQIQKNNIRFIRGYPSSISQFARFVSEKKLNIKIESVYTTAEVLQDIYKKNITKAFRCPIIDTYGCADGGGNANTCHHDNGFHISYEASIWEFCDFDGSNEQNKLKNITLTNLSNYAMPLIRYQPGDLASGRLDTTLCECGRTSPRVDKIFGRTTDVLKFVVV